MSGSSSRLDLGATLLDRYKIIRYVGRGGMGAVYLCEDLRLPGKHWALKEMIPGDPEESSQVRDSFVREARFLAGLRHRSLPLIVDVFEKEGKQYLVMEYIEGRTLAQRIEAEGATGETQALSWALELAQVLDYLHRQDRPIIFRDLKPENIMLTEDGHVKLIDFGLARHFEPGKRNDTQVSGTVGYAPPEQWEDDGQSDARSDIYSLGATLYFVLTGKAPSPVYGNHGIKPHRPDVDPALEAIVERCLAVKPSQRYGSAAELIGDILLLLSHERHQGRFQAVPEAQGPESAGPSPKIQRSGSGGRPLRPPHGTPTQLPAIMVLAALLFVVGLCLPFLQQVRPSPPPAQQDGMLVDVLQHTEPVKEKARRHLDRREYKEAIALLDGLVTRYPQDAEAQILKNNAYALISGSPTYRIPVVSSWHGVERDGFQLLFGWALAQSHINRNRPPHQPLVLLEMHDDRSDPQRSLEIAESLLEDDQVSVMLGPWTSQQSQMIAPLVNGGGLPMLTPAASDPRVLTSGPYTLCVSDTDVNKVQVLADYLYRIGKRKVAVLVDENLYVARSSSELFVRRFQEQGGLIAMQEAFPENQVDFTAQILKAREQGADCFFLAEYRTQPVVSFCESLRRTDWDVAVAAQTASYGGDFLRRGGKAVEGLFLSTIFDPDSPEPKRMAFVEAFRTEFGGRVPTHREAQAYDSLMVVLEALDRVGRDRDKVLEYLCSFGEEAPPYHGVSGRFAPGLHLDARPAHIVQVVNGQYRMLQELASTPG